MAVEFSFIVPVYNVAAYLRQCVDSIISQEASYEIILVNDGSTDESPVICDEYAMLYPDKIRVIHKKNGGLSDARNAGIKIAQGNYLLFVDSDDYISETFLEEIKQTDIDFTADVIFLEIQKVFPDGRITPHGNAYQREHFLKQDKRDVIGNLARLPKFPGSACDKLVRRALFESNDLYFETGLLSEDIDWTIRLYLCAETFDHYSGSYYFYRQNREGSISYNVGLENIESLLYILEKWVNNKGLSAIYRDDVYAFLAYEYTIVLAYYYCLGNDERCKVKKRILKLKWLLDYIKSPRLKPIKLIDNLFGISVTARLLNLYLKIR